MKIFFLLFFIVLLSVSHPITSFGGQIVGTLYVKADKNAAARPAPNTLIQIEFAISEEDTERAYVETDEDGEFKAYLKNIGSCKLIVKYDAQDYSVRIVSRRKETRYEIILEKNPSRRRHALPWRLRADEKGEK